MPALPLTLRRKLIAGVRVRLNYCHRVRTDFTPLLAWDVLQYIAFETKTGYFRLFVVGSWSLMGVTGTGIGNSLAQLQNLS